MVAPSSRRRQTCHESAAQNKLWTIDTRLSSTFSFVLLIEINKETNRFSYLWQCELVRDHLGCTKLFRSYTKLVSIIVVDVLLANKIKFWFTRMFDTVLFRRTSASSFETSASKLSLPKPSPRLKAIWWCPSRRRSALELDLHDAVSFNRIHNAGWCLITFCRSGSKVRHPPGIELGLEITGGSQDPLK
jgi:hypothetical protein